MRIDYTPANNPLRGIIPALALCATWWATVAAVIMAVSR